MNEESYKHLLNDARFKAIVNRKRRLSFILSLFMVLIYLGFILIMAYKPAWLVISVVTNAYINTGFVFTFLFFLIIFISMICYIIYKNNEDDTKLSEIIDEHRDR